MEGVKKSFSFKVLPSFWLMAAWSVFIDGFFLFLLYTISVLIHEFAHFFVAKTLRYTCKNISLSAFGAVLYGDFDEVLPQDAVKIALAGPLTNLGIALFFTALWWIAPSTYPFTDALVFCNYALFFTNLLPCFPLDGGRILVAVLQKKYSFVSSLKTSKILTVIVASILFAIFIGCLFAGVNAFSVGLFAVFVMITGWGVGNDAVYMKQIVFDGYKKNLNRGAEKKCLVFDCKVSLKTVLSALKGTYFYEVTVLKDDKILIVLNQPRLNELFLTCPLDAKLIDLFD